MFVIEKFDRNVTINFSFAAFPIIIRIQGEISKDLSPIGIALVVISSVLILSIVSVVIYRKKLKNQPLPNNTTENIHLSENGIINSIDRQKWKEILTEKESIIFNLILDGNELSQADLCRLAKLSKSTVSRAIGRLEVKGLIKKERFGMSNIVSVNIDFFQK